MRSVPDPLLTYRTFEMVVIIGCLEEKHSFWSPDSAGRDSCSWALLHLGLQSWAFLGC